MDIITKVLVGSRLHGLVTPESDCDYRGDPHSASSRRFIPVQDAQEHKLD